MHAYRVHVRISCPHTTRYGNFCSFLLGVFFCCFFGATKPCSLLPAFAHGLAGSFAGVAFTALSDWPFLPSNIINEYQSSSTKEGAPLIKSRTFAHIYAHVDCGVGKVLLGRRAFYFLGCCRKNGQERTRSPTNGRSLARQWSPDSTSCRTSLKKM